MNQREQLIEKAAKAIRDDYTSRYPEEPPVYHAGPGQPVWRHIACAALAVFEEANTPTVDERARMVAFFHRVTPIIHEPLATQVAEEWVDMFLREFGFHRTVQGEPSDAAVLAALNAYYADYMTGPNKSLDDVRPPRTVQDMRAALRAAAATGGEA